MLGTLAMTGKAQDNLSPILLSCETPLKKPLEPDLEAICEALSSEIKQQFPERKVVDLKETNRESAQGLAANLVVEALRPDHVKGFIQWQNLATNEDHKGPSIQVDGMDGAPIVRLIERFARDVLRVSLPPWEK